MQSRPQVERWSYCLGPFLLNPVSKVGSPATAEARTDFHSSTRKRNSIKWTAFIGGCDYKIHPIEKGHQFLLIYRLDISQQVGAVLDGKSLMDRLPLYESVKNVHGNPGLLPNGLSFVMPFRIRTNTWSRRYTRVLLLLRIQSHQGQGQEAAPSWAERCGHGDISVVPHYWFEGWGPSPPRFDSSRWGRWEPIREGSRDMCGWPWKSRRNRLWWVAVSNLPWGLSHPRWMEKL